MDEEILSPGIINTLGYLAPPSATGSKIQLSKGVPCRIHFLLSFFLPSPPVTKANASLLLPEIALYLTEKEKLNRTKLFSYPGHLLNATTAI